MRKIEVKLRQYIWSFKKCFKPSSYDLVIYQNETYYIKSSMVGNDIWNLYKHEIETPIFYRINGKKLKVKHSWKRFKNNFKQNLSFQEQNWQTIDLEKPFGTRLSYINSDNIVF